MSKKKSQHGSTFKAKVALVALKEALTVPQIAAQFQIHPNMIYKWRRQLLDGASSVFDAPHVLQGTDAQQAEIANLYEQIGRLNVQLDWLKKNLTESTAALRAMIEPEDANLSVRQQCELLGLARSTLYYQPLQASAKNLVLMRLLDEQYLKRPYYGSRRMQKWLSKEGHEVNRKRVQRLMRLMGLEAVYPKPKTTVPGENHEIYPYLLRGVKIERVNQVWSTDITYVPMRRGFLYLTAILDWYSRYVLSWRLSNSLETRFCLEALEEALAQGTPEIFNTDQGGQFTSAAYTGRLKQAKIAISMDGKGRALDNVFVERLWRTVKYEEIYLKAYEDGQEGEESLWNYFQFYCNERQHQALDYRTPWEVYSMGKT
jgi:putative transposase